jgi:uroporphyrinogen-III decarboxylase
VGFYHLVLLNDMPLWEENMSTIKDYPCSFDDVSGVSEHVIQRGNLVFPDAYKYKDMMIRLSKATMEQEDMPFCLLPFCHTVEAEALGGDVNYGDAITGPRAGKYVCETMEEVLKLPSVDYSVGRIHEVLLACRELRDQGEQVVLQIAGPFTILNGLIDARHVFRCLRKNPELWREVLRKLEEELLNYIKEAEKYGVTMVSYADPAGGVNILGPKVAKQVVEEFTYPFLKRVEEMTCKRMLIILCPKTTFALLGTDHATLLDYSTSEPLPYGKGCVQMTGNASFAGQMCIRHAKRQLGNKGLKEVALK